MNVLQVAIQTTLPRVLQVQGGGALPAHTCRELRRWRKEKSRQKKWAGTCPDQWIQPDLWTWTHLIQTDSIQVQAQVFQDLDPPETNQDFLTFLWNRKWEQEEPTDMVSPVSSSSAGSDWPYCSWSGSLLRLFLGHGLGLVLQGLDCDTAAAEPI